MKNIEFRFYNPAVAGTKVTYSLQAKASESLKIFGINLRFFLDGRVFKTAAVDTAILLPAGYKKYNVAHNVMPNLGGLFGIYGPGAYVNGAVECTDGSKAIEVSTSLWTDVLSVSFTLVPGVIGTIFPSLILDKEAISANGGFPPGSNGLTVTELKSYGSGGFITGPTIVSVSHTNWIQHPGTTGPVWGAPTQDEGITL